MEEVATSPFESRRCVFVYPASRAPLFRNPKLPLQIRSRRDNQKQYPQDTHELRASELLSDSFNPYAARSPGEARVTTGSQ